ncbi:MAG TPA: hypothetical protein VI731_01115 [Bacteroidia bacterium]|nr:hypothetical protein [Bacteroidia bacterium]
MKLLFVGLFPVFFIFACNNETPGGGQDTANSDTIAEAPEMLESGTSLPSPLLVAAMFKRSGLKYLPGLTNRTENSSKYTTSITRAQNMGVYSADLAYAILNKQANEGRKYLRTIREIASQINLGKVFDQGNLYDRLNANMEREDSIVSILADIQYATDEQLEQNELGHLNGIIFAGAWVESMYIGSQVYRSDTSQALFNALVTQLAVCNSIIHELKVNQAHDPDIPQLIADLSAIQATIDAMPSMKKFSETPDMELSDVHPSREELQPVIKKIEELRAKIING